MKKLFKKLSLLLTVALLLVAGGGIVTRSPAEVKALNSSAVCDGTTDDTTTINNELASGEVHVILPEGECIQSARIEVGANDWLQGSGRGATTLNKDTQNDHYANVVFDGTDGGTVSDLSVNGNADIDGDRGDVGIYALSGSDNNRIYNNEVYATGDNGIESDGTDTDIYNNYVHDNWTNGIYMIGIHNGGNPIRAERIWVHHNRVEHNSKNSVTWDGIDVDPTTADCIIESNLVIGNDIILFENQGSTSNSYGHKVINNRIIDSPENGINVFGTMLEIEVTGNKIESTTGWGITFNGNLARFKIENNYIIGSTLHGIYFRNDGQFSSTTPSNGRIGDNHIENVGSATSNTYSGIYVKDGANDIMVDGNKVIDTRSPKLMKYAIETNPTTPAGTDLIIFGNKTKTGLTGNIHSRAGQTVSNNF